MPELKCPQCEKTYKTQKGLDKHVATKHQAKATQPAQAQPKKAKKGVPGGGYS